MSVKTASGALFACKFQNGHMQFAYVTATGIYRLAIEIFDNAHEMLRIKQMRNDPKQIVRYLSGQPPFEWYSNELMHLPGLQTFFRNGQILFSELQKQKTINTGTIMELEYIAQVNTDSLCLAGAT